MSLLFGRGMDGGKFGCWVRTKGIPIQDFAEFVLVLVFVHSTEALPFNH